MIKICLKFKETKYNKTDDNVQKLNVYEQNW